MFQYYKTMNPLPVQNGQGVLFYIRIWIVERIRRKAARTEWAAFLCITGANATNKYNGTRHMEVRAVKWLRLETANINGWVADKRFDLQIKPGKSFFCP